MKIAIVSGICVEHDAISAAMASQADVLHGIPEVEDVAIFAQQIERPLPCPGHEVAQPWALVNHPVFREADVAIFHWGIHYPLFDAVTLLTEQGPAPVCFFHNCTPAALCTPEHRPVIERSMHQLELVPWLGLRTWSFSPFNNLTLQSLGVASDHTASVPFPVEPPRRLHPNKPRGRVDVMVVGRIVPAKGTHVLIEALSALGASRLKHLHVRIVGNESLSDQAYAAGLHRRIGELGLHHVVEFVGQLSDEELWSLYERSHLLVSSSLHEGLCVPVIEAYHAGCRVIGTTAANLPFVVSPTDRLVGPEDPAALAEALAATFDELMRGDAHDTTGAAATIQAYSLEAARVATRRELLHPHVRPAKPG